MTQTVVDLDKLLVGSIGKALRIHKQALALTLPYILTDCFPNLSILYGEDKTPIIHDKKKMWKVVCGRETFDISPSYTKGHGRHKDDVPPIQHLLDKGYDGVCFVDFTEVSSVVVKWTTLDDLPDTVNGVYKKKEVFS